MLYIALEIAQLPATLEVFGDKDPAFFSLNDFQDWTKLGLSCLNPPLFVASIWWLWRATNSICIANEDLLFIQNKHNVRSPASLISTAFHSSNN